MHAADTAARKTDPLLSPKAHISTIANDFYQCQFQKVLTAINAVDLAYVSESEYVDLQLFRANALYEMQLVPQSMEILKTFGIFRKIECKASYNYSAGKLSYFEGDYEAAQKYFSEIKFLSDDLCLQFRGLLGLANVYFSKEQDHLLPPILAELTQMAPKIAPPERISFQILLGSYYATAKTDKVLARKYYNLAMNEAGRLSWVYFLNRGLYSLAKLEKQEGNTREMRLILEILRNTLKDSECIWLKFLINEQFKDSTKNTTSIIEIDRCNMRVKLEDRWLELHDKPLLFHFLKMLQENKNFVSKAEIARILWPDRTYLPRTHDPRIFDIAKRARSVIETYVSHPVTLLSGRQGYKLSTSQNAG